MNKESKVNVTHDGKYPEFLCYYFRDAPSFGSVLEMGLDEAKLFLAKHDRDWRSQDDYLDFRLEVEVWIRNEFVRKGGRPKRRYPIYLSLGYEKVLEADPDYKGKLIIPLGLFGKEQISFTYLDSMHTKEGRSPIVFMKDEIMVMIDRFGSGYTEAQVWDDDPLQTIKVEYYKTRRMNFVEY